MFKSYERFGISALLILVLACSAFSFDQYVSKEKVGYMDDEISTQAGFAGPYYFPVELDEQIGDTLTVGYTWRDMQHNGTIGQTMGVGFDPDNGEMVIHLIWTGREGPEEVSEARYNKVFFDENNMPYILQDYENGRRIDAGGDDGFGAYCVLYTYRDENIPMTAYHGRTGATGDRFPYIAPETSFMDFFFNPKHPIPQFPGANGGEWPHMAIGEYNGVKYQHTVIQPNDESDMEQSIFYNRTSYNGTVFTDDTFGGGTQEVSNEAMNLSQNLAVSRDGSKVAIAQTISRWLQRGSIPSDWDGFATSQSDNDIYIWTSDDGGDTWDWDNPLNMTNFIEPNSDYLPDDTLNANQDTMRAYTEIEMSYDADGVLHCIFNVHEFDHYRGTVSRNGRMYYWNDQEQLFSMVGDGSFWNYALERTWEKLISHGSVQKDSDGVLWALWTQAGEFGDTVVVNDTIYTPDASDTYFANNDLYVSASTDNGRRWMKPVNITNTRSTEWDLLPGESRSEIEPSLAPYVDGDYLHVSYTLDFDPGVSVPEPTNGAEGEPTRNQQVYQRVPKADLIQLFEENAEYLRNYPLHIDSSNCYIDENDWEWDSPFGVGVSEEEDTKLTPEQFDLQQNYPNPFNPSTQIAFDLKASGRIKLAVFDVLGREVATLVNRHMETGSHRVTFLADELPSGVYFYKLTSGDAAQVRKMVLMK